MDIFILKKKQQLPITLDEAWRYFSSPKNLMELTPPELSMTITSTVPEVMYAGAIITYQIKPIVGLSMNWVTEITHLNQGESFIDEQRFGPYRFWHHLHTFKETEGGVEIGDLVHYGLSVGPFSKWLNQVYIRPQLEHIFSFREKVLNRKYGVVIDD